MLLVFCRATRRSATHFDVELLQQCATDIAKHIAPWLREIYVPLPESEFCYSKSVTKSKFVVVSQVRGFMCTIRSIRPIVYIPDSEL